MMIHSPQRLGIGHASVNNAFLHPMFVNWDKNSGPAQWPSQAVTVARLSCACNCAD